MVRLRPVPTLQSIAYENLAKLLLSKSPSTNVQLTKFYDSRDAVRQYFDGLASRVRCELMKVAFDFCDNELSPVNYPDLAYPPPLFVLELLFTDDNTVLKFPYSDNFRTKHLQVLLTLLVRMGERLNTLEFVSCGFSVNFFQRLHLFNTSLLVETFVHATMLTCLGIQYICTDEVLKVVGECCTQLETLDASYSVMITDDGLQYLTQNIAKSTNVDEANRSEETFGAANDGFSSFWNIPRVYPSITCDVFVLSNTAREEGDSRYYYYRKKSSLCATLRKLSLKLTHVSYRGLLAVLELMRNLSLLEVDLERFLSDLGREWDSLNVRDRGLQLPRLNLTSVFLSHVSRAKFEMVKLLFPRLDKLKCLGSDIPIAALVDVPTITSLTWTKWANDHNVHRDISQYLRVQGQNLKQLTLIYLDNLLALPNFYLSISIILYYCFNLSDLTMGNSTVRWGDAEPNDHQKLESVCIYGEVTEHALLKLFTCARSLRQVLLPHVCDREGDLLRKLSSINQRPPLEIFRADNLTELGEVTTLLDAYPSIRQLGRIHCSLEDLDLDENVDLELMEDHFSVIQQLVPI